MHFMLSFDNKDQNRSSLFVTFSISFLLTMNSKRITQENVRTKNIICTRHKGRCIGKHNYSETWEGDNENGKSPKETTLTR